MDVRTVQNVNALVLWTTHRYKSKYITTLMYKPKKSRQQQDQDQLDEMNSAI